MRTNYLARLQELLPQHAEEDATREAIGTDELLHHLIQDGGEPGEAAAVLATVRRMFDALCLLELRPDFRDQWVFVSFPASLLGHALLCALVTPGQTLCASDYWRDTGDLALERVEVQRQLLHALESGRVQFSPDGKPPPIRFVYVAWGLIRFGRQFLLVHREDQTRTGFANFVFPGGRFRLDDLPLAQQTAASLRHIHTSHSALALAALPKTLARELEEELGLTAGTHYTAHNRCTIGPYRKVEGTKNRHAYTEYQLVLHDVCLTSSGEARLLQRCAAEPQRLAWFGVEDIAAPAGRPDGKQAFIDALREQLGTALPAFLESTPDSSGTPWRINDDTQAVDIPASHQQPLCVGRTGDEKELALTLTSDTWALLWVIMAHAKGMQLTSLDGHLTFLGGGWIKLQTDVAELAATNLLEGLVSIGQPLVQRIPGSFVRAAIAPAYCYFAEDSFRYCLSDLGQKGELHIRLANNLAPWATMKPTELHIPLNRNMTRALQAIERGAEPEEHYSEEAMKKGIKEMLDSKTRPFGLRKFVRTIANRYHITVPKDG